MSKFKRYMASSEQPLPDPSGLHIPYEHQLTAPPDRVWFSLYFEMDSIVYEVRWYAAYTSIDTYTEIFRRSLHPDEKEFLLATLGYPDLPTYEQLRGWY